MSTHEAVAHIEGEVRELIRRSGIDPVRDGAQMRQLVVDAVQEYDDRALHGGLPVVGDTGEAVRSILSVVAGYGPLQQYFDDPSASIALRLGHDCGQTGGVRSQNEGRRPRHPAK